MIDKLFGDIGYCLIFIYGYIMLFMIMDIKPKEVSKPRQIAGFAFLSLVFLANIWAIFFSKYDIYITYYTLFAQLPLVITVLILSKYNSILQAVFGALSSIIMSIPHMFISTSIASLFGDSDIVYVIFSFPIGALTLYLIKKLVCPSVHYMLKYSNKGLGIICASLFSLNYLSYLISHFHFSGDDFKNTFGITFVLSLARILIFISVIMQFERTRKQAQKDSEHQSTLMQIEAIKAQLSQTEKQAFATSVIRHDMKHNMAIIDGYAKSGECDKICELTNKLNNEINSLTVEKYCENVDLNMVFSCYFSKAQEQNIRVFKDIEITEDINAETDDLSIVFANAIDNAINSTKNIDDKRIYVKAYTEDGKMFAEIRNTFMGDVIFKNDMPYTATPGHGYGTKSMVYIIEKYNGVATFDVENKMFVFKFCV